MLVYDHMLTFGEEVDKIWSRPFTLPTLLFYLNRIPRNDLVRLKSSLIIVGRRCQRYVKFAGASTTSLVAIAELIMILRVYALYLGNKKILAFLLALLCGQVIVSAWAVHNGMRVPQPPGFPGCVLTGKNSFFAALWGAPLVTDSCIFVLTTWRTVRYMRKHGRMTALEILLRDGTLYFFTIFGVNLMNTLIYFLAFKDLKAVGASFSQILTSIMISRLQLNLRYNFNSEDRLTRIKPMFDPNTAGRKPQTTPSIVFTSVLDSDYTNSRSNDERSFFTVGNLGSELQGPLEDDQSSSSSASQTVIDSSAENVELSESPARGRWRW
ncbi:hypothetical protein CVT25_005907 [Psilocybe cyanescens]|uniref:DUF6533 domain-containing protein n=1 Tax=Psilocybe cyanescens TaxID=93625 RepID=A0A409VM58_PSICY|nr:hypothetical protein CVT25_005907 [Psilocybe cyanescens]